MITIFFFFFFFFLAFAGIIMFRNSGWKRLWFPLDLYSKGFIKQINEYFSLIVFSSVQLSWILFQYQFDVSQAYDFIDNCVYDKYLSDCSLINKSIA